MKKRRKAIKPSADQFDLQAKDRSDSSDILRLGNGKCSGVRAGEMEDERQQQAQCNATGC